MPGEDERVRCGGGQGLVRRWTSYSAERAGDGEGRCNDQRATIFYIPALCSALKRQWQYNIWPYHIGRITLAVSHLAVVVSSAAVYDSAALQTDYVRTSPTTTRRPARASALALRAAEADLHGGRCRISSCGVELQDRRSHRPLTPN